MKLTEKGYRNTTVIRGKSKDLPSIIKKDGYENVYKIIFIEFRLINWKIYII